MAPARPARTRSRSRPATRPTSRSLRRRRSRLICRRARRTARGADPGLTTVDEVAEALGVSRGAALKAMPVIVEGRGMVLARARRPSPQRDQARTPWAPSFARPRPRRSRPSSARPGSSGRRHRSCPCSRTPRSRARVLRRRQSAPTPPDRRRARTRLRVRGGRHPPVEPGDLSPSRRPDRGRDCDRGRQHLQARNRLRGAARRPLPGPGRQGAPDRDGLLRDRSRADPRGRGRAGSRRGRDRWPRALAPGRSTSSSSGRRATRRSRPPSASTSSSARRGSSRSTTTATPARARS